MEIRILEKIINHIGPDVTLGDLMKHMVDINTKIDRVHASDVESEFFARVFYYTNGNTVESIDLDTGVQASLNTPISKNQSLNDYLTDYFANL